jgi:hypothetical protein
VGSTAVTSEPLAQGFMDLAAILGWDSRDVIAWRLSNTQEAQHGSPEGWA